MRRFVSASAALLLFALTPLTGFGAPIATRATATTNPSIILAQGWWERENTEQRARQGYWGLQSLELRRYNRLQYEINQLQQQRRVIDERISRLEQEQHRILRFEGPGR